MACRHTRVDPQRVVGLIAGRATVTQRLLLTQVRNGVAGRLLLLAIQGGTPDELAQASNLFGQRLRASGQLDLVENGTDMFTGRDREILFRSRYLLSRQIGPDSFSVNALRHSLEQRLDDLRSPLAPMIKDTIPGDPTGELLGILSAWSGQEGPASYRGVWMSDDHSRALLLVQTRAPAFDADAQAVVQDDIRRTFAQATGESSAMYLLMTGPGVFTVHIQRTIETEAWWLSAAAATLVLLFLYFSYRSPMLVLLSLIPLSSGILAGMLAVQGWFGFIHGITLGFGITLLGVVDDYPIHLFSHLTARDSAPAVIRAIWPTMRLGVLTTAIGFASLLLAGFPALAQLGLFAVAGLLTAAAVTRWILPVLVPTGFVPRDIGPAVSSAVRRLRGDTIIIPVVVGLASAALLWSHTPLWETDLASLNPVSEDTKRLDQRTSRGIEGTGCPRSSRDRGTNGRRCASIG